MVTKAFRFLNFLHFTGSVSWHQHTTLASIRTTMLTCCISRDWPCQRDSKDISRDYCTINFTGRRNWRKYQVSIQNIFSIRHDGKDY